MVNNFEVGSPGQAAITVLIIMQQPQHTLPHHFASIPIQNHLLYIYYYIAFLHRLYTLIYDLPTHFSFPESLTFYVSLISTVTKKGEVTQCSKLAKPSQAQRYIFSYKSLQYSNIYATRPLSLTLSSYTHQHLVLFLITPHSTALTPLTSFHENPHSTRFP